MLQLRILVSMLPLLLVNPVAQGQDYPHKPVRIVTSEAGGGNDFVARVIAPALAGNLRQNVIVENRSSLIAIEAVARAQPDGYTLLLPGQTLWIGPLLRKLPYDPIRDFAPISMTSKTPSILVVHPAVPVKSVRDLIDLAKARPGELNYGSPALGSAQHLAPELFKAMAGVNIVHVPFKGSGPAIINLIGGQVQLMFPNLASVATHVKSGRLRALAVTSAAPSVLAPGMPTVADTLPGYEVVDAKGMFAPRGTPAALIARINREVVKTLNQPDLKEAFLNAGVEVVGSTPEQFAHAIASEITRLGKVIKDAGIRIE